MNTVRCKASRHCFGGGAGVAGRLQLDGLMLTVSVRADAARQPYSWESDADDASEKAQGPTPDARTSSG